MCALRPFASGATLLIGDMQIRRVTGALDAPTPGEIAARAEVALERLRALFPPIVPR